MTDITTTIEHRKIIVIIRKVYGEKLEKLVRALYAGGIRLVEITYDQADPDCENRTSDAIQLLYSNFPDDLIIGAGTVLTVGQVQAAYDAHAKFIISPNVDRDVIEKTKDLGMTSIPGAMTPSEILQAHKLGADFVKIFPANDLGLQYIKDIKAPISHVKMLATGGVNEENFAAHLSAGYIGAGISGRLTDKLFLESENYIELTRRARFFHDIAKTFEPKGA